MGKRIEAAVLACLISGTAMAGTAADRPFLSFHRIEARSGTSITVHVGLRDRRPGTMGEPGAEDLWFSATFADGNTRRPPKWAEGGRCPAAVAKLREVERLSMPSPRIPLEDGEAWGDIVMDGADYALDADTSALDGQMTGPIHFSSNVDTGLAKWVDGMLAALAPCWSADKPRGLR